MAHIKILFILAFSFIKIGIIGFGGGFAMIPLMQDVSVNQYHWLSQSQFSAAIAMGQVTPGPVAISATFIGYKVAGILGAVTATLGIFTPSILIMYLLSKFYLEVRKNRITQGVMHGVVPIVVALILNVAISLGRPAIHSFWQSMVIALVAILAIKYEVNYGLLIIGSMLCGIIFKLYGRYV